MHIYEEIIGSIGEWNYDQPSNASHVANEVTTIRSPSDPLLECSSPDIDHTHAF